MAPDVRSPAPSPIPAIAGVESLETGVVGYGTGLVVIAFRFVGLGEVTIILEVVLEGAVAEVKKLLLRIAEEVVKEVVEEIVDEILEDEVDEVVKGIVEVVVERVLEEEEAEEVLRAVK